LRHEINEESPLHGATIESLEAERALFFVSVVGIDPVIAAEVQTQKDYSWRDLKFGQRFVEIYHESKGRRRRLTVDYGRLHDTDRLDSKSCSQLLPADQNKNTAASARFHDDYRNDDGVNEQAEPGEDEIDSEQEHTKIFRNVNHVCLSLGEDVDLSRRVRFVTTKKVDRPLAGDVILGGQRPRLF